MKSFFNLLLYFVFFLLIQGCNTLYNSRMVNIEVYKPGKFVFPANYQKVAVRYNNCNVSLNPVFSKYFLVDKVLSDTTNIDSIAAEIYYQAFLENLQQQHSFDSVMELSPGNYSNSVIIDQTNDTTNYTSVNTFKNITNTNLRVLGKLVQTYSDANYSRNDTVYIYPNLGLYTKNNLIQIADSTGADLLFSLDYFASIDETIYLNKILFGTRYVLSQGFWNVYDLKPRNLKFSENKIDTVSWEAGLISHLPPRKDAILNAAEISGSKFAEIAFSHWTDVERLYYRSGQLELKKTETLIKEGKWLEAAKIWKANINNPNKNIAAKSMFNMGLACEMQGDFDAAIDWVVHSYHILGQNNTIHAMNCQDYIKILAERKMDLKRIGFQLKQEATLID